ncbi:MAG: aldehyde dehydrogenase [Actinomycetales bacterium]|nr:aldehyde dehydrogenase [Actinomycetales bacterium]
MSLGIDDPAARYRELAARYAPEDGQPSFEVHNPSTGDLLARFPTHDAEHVDRVVAAARAAARTWRAVPTRERARLLKTVAQRLRDAADEIATLESLEMGKTFLTARSYDMHVCAESFEFFGSLIENERGSFVPGAAIDSYSVREPYGVVAGIIPFNWPPIHTGAKLAPALAAGNVVILKPPEQCPLSVLRVIEIVAEVVPADVVQAVTGIGSVTGTALTGHPGIDRISFTGSPATARHVLHAAAEHFTGALLELGGKNPLLVFDDADLEQAVPTAVEASFMNQGQACTAASRILVHESVAARFTELFVKAVADLRMGDPLEADTELGPLVTSAHRDRVESYIEVGLAEGAHLAYRGERPADPVLAGGYFVAPHVLDGVTPQMRVAQEEIFGPVATILTFRDLDEALEIANGTEFALVAGVFTADPVLARRAADAIDAGVVFVNNYNRSFLPTTPFGGNRASGYGREHVAETLHEFSRIKSVRIANGLEPAPLSLRPGVR